MPPSLNLDLTTSLHMAKVAYTIYGRPASPCANTTWTNARLTEVSTFTTRQVRCCVGFWHSGTRASVVVAFRGSATGAEWASNVPLAQWQPFSSIIAGRVHPGFAHSLAAVWEDVVAAVHKLSQAHLPELLNGYAAGRSVPVCFAGHSRGGALAVLAGLRALTTFVLPVGVYTYGAPRVGDGEFAQAYKEMFEHGASEHWRFEGEGDPVPVFPFVVQARHTGSLVYLRKGSRIVQILGSERHQGKRFVQALPAKPSQAHRMTTYLGFLRQAVAIETVPPHIALHKRFQGR